LTICRPEPKLNCEPCTHENTIKENPITFKPKSYASAPIFGANIGGLFTLD
jgi:hypothetical protein